MHKVFLYYVKFVDYRVKILQKIKLDFGLLMSRWEVSTLLKARRNVAIRNSKLVNTHYTHILCNFSVAKKFAKRSNKTKNTYSLGIPWTISDKVGNFWDKICKHNQCPHHIYYGINSSQIRNWRNITITNLKRLIEELLCPDKILHISEFLNKQKYI